MESKYVYVEPVEKYLKWAQFTTVEKKIENIFLNALIFLEMSVVFPKN